VLAEALGKRLGELYDDAPDITNVSGGTQTTPLRRKRSGVKQLDGNLKSHRLMGQFMSSPSGFVSAQTCKDVSTPGDHFDALPGESRSATILRSQGRRLIPLASACNV